MAVTLADVATRARVSTATVSRVLNGNYPVAENTRARVLRAVAELEYVVNGPASALAAATSDLVASSSTTSPTRSSGSSPRPSSPK